MPDRDQSPPNERAAAAATDASGVATSRRWRDLLVNLSLAVASTLVFLLLLEGLGILIIQLDRAGYYEPDHRNSLGLRDPREPGHTADRRVILTLGDSHTYGVGVPYADSYSALLEGELRSRPGGADVVVVNGGLGGADTEIAYRQLERLFPLYQPDVVVLGFHTADISQNRIARRSARQTNLEYARRSEAGATAADDADLQETIHIREEEFPLSWRLQAYLRRKSNAMAVFSFYYKCYLIRFLPAPDANLLRQGMDSPEFEPSVYFLDLIHELLAERGGELVLLSIPPLNRFDSYPNERLDTALEQYAAARGVHHVSPLAALSGYDAASLRVTKVDGHYNAQGNRVLAEVLAEFIDSRRLLSQGGGG